MATIEDFGKLDIRVGKIVNVEVLPDAKYSTHKLIIDLGEELGQKKSCARLVNYTEEELLGRQVLCVVNFPPRQVGKSMSEVLTLGVPDADGECALILPITGNKLSKQDVPLGGKLY